MASKAGQPEAEKVDIEEALDYLDKTLDRTKVLYEQYFLGMQKQPPTQIHSDVERRLRDLQQMSIRNTGLRYRFATLQQKFGSYNSYWRRTLRQIENGTYIRNLQKISRQAALSGEAIPEEILAAMPKRMREQVKRDREQAIAIAKRRNEGATDDFFEEDVDFGDDDDVGAVIGESPELIRQIPRGGAQVVDESDADLDFEAFFASVEMPDEIYNKVAADKAAAVPPAPRETPPVQQSRGTGPVPGGPRVPTPMPTGTLPPQAPAAPQPVGGPPRAVSQPGVAGGPQQPRAVSQPGVGGGPQQPRAVSQPGVAGGPQQPRAVSQPGVVGGPQQPRAVSQPGVAGGPQQPRAVSQPGVAGGPQQPRAVSQPGVTGGPQQPGQPPSQRATVPMPSIPGQVPAHQRATVAMPSIPGQPVAVTAAIPTITTTQIPTVPGTTSAIPTITTSQIPTIPGQGASGPIPTSRATGPVPIVPTPHGSAMAPGSRPAVPAPGASAIPRPANVPRPMGAPSQASRPNPIAPGSSAARAAVPVETMAGPFPRAAAPPVNARPEPMKAPAPKPQAPPRAPPGMNDADVNALYATYVKAKQAVGEEAGPGAYGKLLQTINAQAPKIMEQYKAKGVTFSVVVKDNQVVIKAKPKT